MMLFLTKRLQCFLINASNGMCIIFDTLHDIISILIIHKLLEFINNVKYYILYA